MYARAVVGHDPDRHAGHVYRQVAAVEERSGEARPVALQFGRRRLGRGLLQREVAAELGVDPFTVLNWERNKVEPLARLMSRVVGFLGYHPSTPPGSVADWLRTARRALGLTQRDLGQLLGVDPATVPSWETGRHRPTWKLLARLRTVLAVR